MSVYIVSTMTAPVAYGIFNRDARDNPICHKKITIFGARNVSSSRSGYGEMSNDEQGRPIWTAEGFCTPVSDSDYELLKEQPIFKKHVEKKLLKVINRDVSKNYGELTKHTSGMEQDRFSIMTPKSLKEHSGSKVRVVTHSGENGMIRI